MSEVIIVNQKKFDKKAKKISRGGKDSIHVLSDFDRTLTKCFVGDKKSSTSWAQFRNLNLLGKEYIEQAHKMFDFYRPFETSKNLGLNKKAEKMKEWWKRHLDLLVQTGLTKKEIGVVVKKGGIEMREGADYFFEILEKNKIPLVIISSGLGDIIEGVLEENKLNKQNVHVLSNFFEFSGDKATGFKNKIIHSINKTESELKSLPIFAELKKRKNIILIGDSIDDLQMVKFPFRNVLKIGFLNENVDENLETFKENFDVILLGDQDMKWVNNFLEEILR